MKNKLNESKKTFIMAYMAIIYVFKSTTTLKTLKYMQNKTLKAVVICQFDFRLYASIAISAKRFCQFMDCINIKS